MTHTSRANEDVSGGVVDNESMEFLGDALLGFVDRRPAVPRLPALRRRAEVEDQGVGGVDGDAGEAGRAAAARGSPAARPRRGEDRRPPQAGAARRHLRGADRGDLSRRRHRARARVHRPRVHAAARRGAARRRDRAGLQVGAAGAAAVARPAAARLPPGRHARGRITASCSRSRSAVRGEPLASATGASKKEAEQEAARAALEKLRTRRRSSELRTHDFVREASLTMRFILSTLLSRIGQVLSVATHCARVMPQPQLQRAALAASSALALLSPASRPEKSIDLDLALAVGDVRHLRHAVADRAEHGRRHDPLHQLRRRRLARLRSLRLRHERDYPSELRTENVMVPYTTPTDPSPC